MAEDISWVKKLWSRLYIRLLIGIALGILIGAAFPLFGVKLKILGDLFIKLIRMLLAPIIFGTVVVGIARMGDLKSFGRVGAKSLIYFEVVSTLALIIGLVVVNVVRPGAGMNVDASAIDIKPIAGYAAAAQNFTVSDFLLSIVPTSAVGAFVDGNMLQVIFFSVLFGIALSRIGESKDSLIEVLDGFVRVMFVAVGIVMQLAPLAALGAMASVVGKFGLKSLESFGWLIASLYVTCLIFIFGVLGAIAWWNGFSLWGFLKYIKEEIAVVFGTCSTEAVLPRMMTKLESLGCQKAVVGLVLPAGYAFNADGTSIYLTMASIFIAQATDTRLGLGQQILLLAVLLLTSKGSAGVAGAGFIALAATLSSIHTIPMGGLVLLLGAESFLNQARAVTNVIGNGVATIVISKWEGKFDQPAIPFSQPSVSR